MAAQGLKNIVKEMEQRYQLFATLGARDVIRYNELAEEGEKPLPYIIVVIDELADLMMTAAAEVEDAICRIAQNPESGDSPDCRYPAALGRCDYRFDQGQYHHPDCLCRFFRPTPAPFSIWAAPKLLGRGDMLYHPVGAAKPRRLQSAFISSEEVEKVVAHVLGQAVPVLRTDFMDVSAVDDESQPLEMTNDARGRQDGCRERTGLDIFLQRRLRIGYNRAA